MTVAACRWIFRWRRVPGRAATAPRHLAAGGGLVQTALIGTLVARTAVVGRPVVVSAVIARTVIASTSVVSAVVISTVAVSLVVVSAVLAGPVVARVRSTGPVPLVVPVPPGTAVFRVPGTARAAAAPVTTPALGVTRAAPAAWLSGFRGVGAGKVWVTHASSLVG